MTYEQLCAALALTRRIDRLKERRGEWRDPDGSARSMLRTRVQGGRAVSAAQAAAEITDEIEAMETRREALREDIRRYVDGQPLDELERRVVLLRHVECRPWALAAYRLGYTCRHVLRIYGRALQKMSFDVT